MPARLRPKAIVPAPSTLPGHRGRAALAPRLPPRPVSIRHPDRFRARWPRNPFPRPRRSLTTCLPRTSWPASSGRPSRPRALAPREPRSGAARSGDRRRRRCGQFSENEIATAMLAPIEATPLDTPLPPARAAAEAPPSGPGLCSRSASSPCRKTPTRPDRPCATPDLCPPSTTRPAVAASFWRVVVGPAPTAEDRAAILDTVRGARFRGCLFRRPLGDGLPANEG